MIYDARRMHGSENEPMGRKIKRVQCCIRENTMQCRNGVEADEEGRCLVGEARMYVEFSKCGLACQVVCCTAYPKASTYVLRDKFVRSELTN